MSLYSKKVLKNFTNPKNLGVIKSPDGQAMVGNPVCGDVMKMYLRIEQRAKSKGKKTSAKGQKEEYIKDIKFQTLGCAAAIATSSITTQMVKGKSLNQAAKITNQQIAKALGGLPTEKVHCSLLAVQALKKAIENYRQKQK